MQDRLGRVVVERSHRVLDVVGSILGQVMKLNYKRHKWGDVLVILVCLGGVMIDRPPRVWEIIGSISGRVITTTL